MEPFYFGEDEEIFGIYHAAEGMPKRHSVIIAAPLLNEYMRAHFALRRIALRLARMGFDVLRFDYSGMGNSKGSLEDTSATKWEGDLAAARHELSEISGNSTLSIVAVRFSANLAASVSQHEPFDQFVMWDPVLDGPHWLELLRSARPIVTTKFSESLLVKDREFMGHVTHPTFVDDINARQRVPIRSRKISAVVTDKDDMRDSPGSLAENVDHVPFSCRWEDLSSQVLYPHEVIDSICAAIT